MKLKSLIPFYKNYVQAMSRVSALEMAFDYVLRSPEYSEENSPAFNGQSHRKMIFSELISTLDFQAILETGTFMGNTTGFIRNRVKCPVVTCEASSMFQSVAISRLRKLGGIDFVLGDSRKFLQDQLKDRDSKFPPGPLFFYLDAHWHNDLPLADEIRIIAMHVPECVLMVDDFQVPEDYNYTYDNYGPGKSLDMRTFGKVFSEAGMQSFFPSIPGTQETGAKRGCVVLGRGEQVVSSLYKIPSLRPSNVKI